MIQRCFAPQEGRNRGHDTALILINRTHVTGFPSCFDEPDFKNYITCPLHKQYISWYKFEETVNFGIN